MLVNTYINEVAPRGGRARYTSLILILSAIGSLLGIWAGLLLTTPPAPFPYGVPFALNVQPFGWRILYFVGAALMLVGILLRAQLPESPRWLVSRGRLRDADTVVREMEDRAAHRAPLPQAMDEIPVKSGKAETPFGLLFKNPFYLKRTVLLLAMWLTGYVTLYSYLAGLTTILATLGYSPSEGGLIVAVGVTGFVFAAVASYCLCERMERKYWLPVAVFLTIVGGLLLATAGPAYQERASVAGRVSGIAVDLRWIYLVGANLFLVDGKLPHAGPHDRLWHCRRHWPHRWRHWHRADCAPSPCTGRVGLLPAYRCLPGSSSHHRAVWPFHTGEAAGYRLALLISLTSDAPEQPGCEPRKFPAEVLPSLAA